MALRTFGLYQPTVAATLTLLKPLTILSTALLLTLAACSSQHQIDRAAWGADLSSAGMTVKDWSKLEAVTKQLCDDDQNVLEFFIAGEKDAGRSLKSTELGFKYVSPDKMQKFEDAVAGVARGSGEVDQACNTPASERTEQQALLAEAMGW